MLRGPRVTLRPVVRDDAIALAEPLTDVHLYTFMGGEAPSRERLIDLFASWELRVSPDHREQWLNWTISKEPEQQAIGYVQVTVSGNRGTIAYVVGRRWQGQGLATEASVAVLRYLQQSGVVSTVDAWIAPGNIASERVAAALGLTATETIDQDGERRWVRTLEKGMPLGEVHDAGQGSSRW